MRRIIGLFCLLTICLTVPIKAQSEFLEYGKSGFGFSLAPVGVSPDGSGFLFNAGFSFSGVFDMNMQMVTVSSGRSSSDQFTISGAYYPLKQGRANMSFSLAIGAGYMSDDRDSAPVISVALIERIDISKNLSLQPMITGSYIAKTYGSGTGGFGLSLYYSTPKFIYFITPMGVAGTAEGSDGYYGVAIGMVFAS